jgi:hypothetical protein
MRSRRRTITISARSLRLRGLELGSLRRGIRSSAGQVALASCRIALEYESPAPPSSVPCGASKRQIVEEKCPRCSIGSLVDSLAQFEPMPLPELTWNYILKTRRENGGDPIVSVETAEGALLHLRSTLGEDVIALPERVLRTLLDWSPWTYRWLTWLSNSIARVERMDGFASLRQRLADRSKFAEAYSVLQVADRLVAADLAVRFDIPVQVGLSFKVPDMLVADSETGANFYCEVSTLYSAQGHGDQSRLLNAVHSVLIQRTIPVAFAGRLLRPIGDEEFEGLMNRIQWELIEIENDSSFHEFEVGDALQLALAPVALRDRVAVWAQEHGLQPDSLSAALPASDPLARLRRKIEEEAEQLPAGQPNLVVILAQDLLMVADRLADLLTNAPEIVSEHRKVTALALTCEDFGPVVSWARKIGDTLYAVSDRDGLVHKQILILNRSCPETFPASTLEKLYLAFSH